MTDVMERAGLLDASDPLAHFRNRFVVPDGVIYLDGNSLGALPVGVAERLRDIVQDEWGRGLIRSWNDANWYPAPIRIGDRIGGLIGAAPGQVAVCDSTSINLFKVLCAALRAAPDRNVLIVERDNFPTNTYIAHSVADLLNVAVVSVESGDVADLNAAVEDAGERLAVVSLTEVNYKTGWRYSMPSVTDRVHSVGGRMVWDLCHSAGAFPVDLDGCGVDYAVGCTYKYLNGGPGAPAFVYVAARHLDGFDQPLHGWHGHAAPFSFDAAFEPAPGIDRALAGTAAQLSLLALEAALDAFDGVDMNALRAKSLALTDLFMEVIDAQRASDIEIVTPRSEHDRGSQVALRHPNGYAIVQALIARNVIGDFRAPDVLRFGFAPLYLSHTEVVRAALELVDVVTTRAWDRPEFTTRRTVT
jgi:kynureninase